MTIKSTTSHKLSINETLIKTLNEGFTGIKNALNGIGTDVKTLAEKRRESSSRLAAPTKAISNKDLDWEHEEKVDLLLQLLVNKDLFNDVSVRDDNSGHSSITLDIETGLKEGNEMVHHGLEVSIYPDSMVIYPHRNLPSVGMKLDTQGKEKYSDPSLEKIRRLIEKAIPQDELNVKQRDVFNSFFNSREFITRDD